jgi:hypothetical protein
MRVGFKAKSRLGARPLHHPREASRRERRAALGREYKGRLGLLLTLKSA